METESGSRDMLRRIRQVRCGEPYRLELVFEGGETGEVDLSSLIAAGGVWARLSNRSEFGKVRVGPGGRFIEWPGELDLCADALWQQVCEGQPGRV